MLAATDCMVNGNCSWRDKRVPGKKTLELAFDRRLDGNMFPSISRVLFLMAFGLMTGPDQLLFE